MVNLGKSQGAFSLNNFAFISSASVLQSFEKLQVLEIHGKVLKDCVRKGKMNMYRHDVRIFSLPFDCCCFDSANSIADVYKKVY